MGKLFKIFAFILGTFTLATGLTSCKDDPECCTWTDDYGDLYIYCEDNIEEGYSFSYYQALSAYYNGTCK